MADNMVFEETNDIPAGRQARVVPKLIFDKLAESSKRKVGFSLTGTEAEIEELRKNLGAASVKSKYNVTTETAKLDGGKVKLTFAATAK